jgi:hypothetical protein
MANLNEVIARLRTDDLRREAEAERVARRMLPERGGPRRRRVRASRGRRAAGPIRSAGAWLASRVLTRTSAVLESGDR